MGDSLNPTLAGRLGRVLRPDWSRTLRARRVAAGGLVVLAGVAAVRSDPAADRADVLVLTHDLGAGTALSVDDVRIEKRLAATVPDGAQADPAAALGATLAGPARRGEMLTDVRLLGPRLADAAAGPNARMVPVHPADTAVLDLLRPGDVVDILAASDVEPSARVVAGNAVVVLVSAREKAQGPGDRVVLVALPAAAATAVAAAALVQTVTLALH